MVRAREARLEVDDDATGSRSGQWDQHQVRPGQDAEGRLQTGVAEPREQPSQRDQ